MSNPNQTSFRSWFTHKRVNIPAGQTVTLNVTGQVFICTEAQRAFRLALGHGAEFVPFNLGMKLRFAGDDYFDRIALQNTGAEDNSIEFFAAAGDFEDSRLNVVRDRPAWWSDAPTVVKTHALTSLAGGAFEECPGWETPGSGYGQRKAIIVTNLDPALDLEIKTPAGGLIGTVMYRQAWKLETSADLRVHNDNASPVVCRISEVFYEEA